MPLIHACIGSAEYRKINGLFHRPRLPRLAGHLCCREGAEAHCEGGSQRAVRAPTTVGMWPRSPPAGLALRGLRTQAAEARGAGSHIRVLGTTPALSVVWNRSRGWVWRAPWRSAWWGAAGIPFA